MQRDRSGILAIWHDLTSGKEDEMLDWYDREHHIERVLIPGFQSVRRYEAVDEGVERLFNIYEVDSPSVLTSPEYLSRVNNPTAWSLACEPLIRNNTRTVCQRVVRYGWPGGFVAAVRFKESAPVLELSLLKSISADISGICGAEFWVADESATNIKTDEKRLRVKKDNTIAGAIVVHATRLDKLRNLTTSWENSAPWKSVESTRAIHFSLSFELSRLFLSAK